MGHRWLPPAPNRVRDGLAFVVPGTLLAYYALRGGSYDIVVRQEEGLAIWWVIALGLAFGLFPRHELPRGAWMPLSAGVIYAAWTVLSLSWTESDERTLAEVARVAHLLGVVLLVWLCVDRTTWRCAAGGLAAASVAITLLAVGSRLWPGPFPIDYTERAFKNNRLNYPFDYWNAVAAWGAMSITLALGCSSHARHSVVRALALAAVPGLALAVYLSYSRAGVVGTAAGVVLVFVLGRHRWRALLHLVGAAAASALVIIVARGQPDIAESTGGDGAGLVAVAVLGGALACAVWVVAAARLRPNTRWRMPPRSARGALVTLAVSLLVAGVIAGPSMASQAWEDFRDPTPSASSGDPAARLGTLGGTRYQIWSSALDAFAEKPAHGIGAGAFEFWWSRNQQQYSFERDAHNLFLEQLAELGVPGLVLLLTALAGLVFVAFRSRMRAQDSALDVGLNGVLIASFAVFLIHASVDWMWESTAVAALGLAGIAVACCARSHPAVAPRLARRLPLAVVAIAIALVQVPGLVSTSRIRDSQAAARHGDTAGASRYAFEAVDTEPWAASPYVQAALVSEATRELPQAAALMRGAIRREPTNWRHPFILSRIEAERGRVPEALEAFRRAKRLRPRSRFYPAR